MIINIRIYHKYIDEIKFMAIMKHTLLQCLIPCSKTYHVEFVWKLHSIASTLMMYWDIFLVVSKHIGKCV